MEIKNFFITTIGNQLDTSDLLITEDTLNAHIDLSEFGDKIKRIVFFGMTDPENSQFYEPYWNYDSTQKILEGRLSIDHKRAQMLTDIDAQQLICEAIFDLFQHFEDMLPDFDFKGLKMAMLSAVKNHPVLVPKGRLRIYSDLGIPTGDFPELADQFRVEEYGPEIKRINVELTIIGSSAIPGFSSAFITPYKGVLNIKIVSRFELSHFKNQLKQINSSLKGQDLNFVSLEDDLLKIGKQFIIE